MLYRAQTCVIFATFSNSFLAVTVRDDFFVRMYPYGNKTGVCGMMLINGGVSMKSSVIKRSIVVAGHKTSVSLEDAFWRGLKEIAGGRNVTLSELVAAIDSARQHGNLSSAIRLFVLDFYRKQLFDLQEGRDTAREPMGRSAAAYV